MKALRTQSAHSTGYGAGTAAKLAIVHSAGSNAAAGEQRFPWLEAAATPRPSFNSGRILVS